MSVIPRYFRKSGEGVIASYDFTDIVEKTGVIKFYGYASRTSSAYDYHLSTTAIPSAMIAVHLTGNGVHSDLDFDSSALKQPITLYGTAVVTCSLSVEADAGHTATGNITAYVRKWDGVTETEIASAVSQTVTDADAAANKEYVVLPIVIPRTTFKIGETLRLTIDLYGECASGTGFFSHGLDPSNRDDVFGGCTADITPSTDGMTTQLNFYCPFDIDL